MFFPFVKGVALDLCERGRVCGMGGCFDILCLYECFC